MCPNPHEDPIQKPLHIFFDFETIVDTATTWSASVACLNPIASPRTNIVIHFESGSVSSKLEKLTI